MTAAPTTMTTRNGGQMTTNLEHLRQIAGAYFLPISDTMHKAADEIERLRARVAELEASNAGADGAVQTLRARIDQAYREFDARMVASLTSAPVKAADRALHKTDFTGNDMEPFIFDYANYRSERSRRYVWPIAMEFKSTPWHPERQWIMRAFDIVKAEEREFAMNDMTIIKDSTNTRQEPQQ